MATNAAGQERITAEIHFDRAVKILLTSGRSHKDLSARLTQLATQVGEKLPPKKVLISQSYGNYQFSQDFQHFLATQPGYKSSCSRSDPIVIKAIIDFGRITCEDAPHKPHLLNAYRTAVKWNIERLMDAILWQREEVEKEFEPNLVTSAKAAIRPIQEQNSLNKHVNFVTYAKYIKDPKITKDAFLDNGVTLDPLRCAIWFAHTVLLAKERAKYTTEKDEVRDLAIYQRVGVYFAGSKDSRMKIVEVPALVHYVIDEYDGMESVRLT